METIEGNKLIAEFMGLVVVPAGTKAIGQIKHPEISEAFLKYDTSWDWLMPVWVKVVQQSLIHTTKENYTIMRHQVLMLNFSEAVHGNNPQAAWEVVVPFILWLKTYKAMCNAAGLSTNS